jgi:hypothetical protein
VPPASRTPTVPALAGLALAGLIAASPARAVVSPGDVAPAFTKSELAGGPGSWTTGPPHTLAEEAGKVVVLFLLGYS